MITVDKIRWGTYRNYAGPWYAGSVRVPSAMPDSSFNEKAISVITATEGGHSDAINMYDGMILTAGVIQWAEKGQNSVSDMLGFIHDHVVNNIGAGAADEVMAPLTEYLNVLCDMHPSFHPNARGRWRFYIGGDEVDTVPEQTRLFLLNSNGQEGTWDEKSKFYAKQWAATVASILSHPWAQQAQTDFTVPKLVPYFVLQKVKDKLFQNLETSGMIGALKAIYLSFAANNPSRASEAFLKATECMKGSLEQNTPLILKHLTFDSGYTIYPARYNAVRPVAEKLFGVDLPDFASELKQFEDELSACTMQIPGIDLKTTMGIQQGLLRLGYDLGPSKADGRMGNKTREAIMAFQQSKKLQVDGVVGPKTAQALSDALA